MSFNTIITAYNIHTFPSPPQAAGADMETHTLARFICESTLQEYEYVTERPSHIASAAMYLALRMKNLGQWVSMCVYMCVCVREGVIYIDASLV